MHQDPVPRRTPTAARGRLDDLAANVGRLRRRTSADTSAAHLLDRIAGDIEVLHMMLLEPTAAELAATTAPGDETAITEAIRIVDERQRRLRHLLGEAA